MIIENPSPYLRCSKGEDDFDGADELIVTVQSEGVRRESNFRDKNGNVKIVYDFNVKLPDGRVKIVSVKGQKGIGWMLANWGKDSSKYVGKSVSVYALRNQLVAGKKVSYVTMGYNPLGDEAAPIGDSSDEPEEVPPPDDGGPDEE